MSLNEEIECLEKKLKEAKKRRKELNFNENVIFENDFVVIEKKGKRLDILAKRNIGDPRRRAVRDRNGGQCIITNTCHVAFHGVEDIDIAIKCLKEVKEFLLSGENGKVNQSGENTKK